MTNSLFISLQPQASRTTDDPTVHWIGSPRWRTPPSPDITAGAPVDGKSLISGYLRWHEDLPKHLAGSFAIAVRDESQQLILLATDRIGRYALYYTTAGGTPATSNSLRTLAGHADRPARVSAQALLDYVYFHVIPAPRTVFEDYYKLPPATVAVLKGSIARLTTYWQPSFEEGHADLRELSMSLRDTLGSSVAEMVPAIDPVGCYLSGGLDSSTVVGFATRAAPTRTHSFSIGFDAPDYDELDFARIASRHFGSEAHERYVSPDDILDALPRVAVAFEEPFGNSSALPSYCCAVLAREHGFDTLLAGDGGDEIFGGNERYRLQLVFELFGHLPSGLRKGLVESTTGRLGRVGNLLLARKGASYIRQASVPLPARLQTYNFLERHAPAEVFSDELLRRASIDESRAIWDARYHEPADASALNRMLYLDWQFTLADNDLVKVRTSAALAGVDVRFPFLSDDMLDLSCRVPSRWKIRRFGLRWFYKQAMRGFLPEQILNKKKHGFGLPFGIWTRDDPRLRALIDDALGSLRRRGVFRPEFIDESIRMHRDVHAGYYGELIWLLTVLELWLRDRKVEIAF